MNCDNKTFLTLNQCLNFIGNKIYSHKYINKINEDNNNHIIFPSPSTRVVEEAIQEINESLYHILHVARFSGNYCLILTKFKNKLYKVFYNYNKNNTVSYSYNEYNDM